MHIPHSRPFTGESEQRAIGAVLGSGYLSAGPWVEKLEKLSASLLDQKIAIAVSSGTAALYLALRGLCISKDDSVIIPSNVCTAVLNAVMFLGASPVLCDVNPHTGLMEPDNVRCVLDKKVKAIIVPHLFGTPADATGVEALGIPVIEDCAQCAGTTIDGRAVGGLTTVSIISFYATKIIAAGEGGVVATSDRAVANRIRDFLNYDNRDSYVPRFNLKLSDVNAAIAVAQIKKIGAMNSLRRLIASEYKHVLETFSQYIIPLSVPAGCKPMHYRFVVRIPKKAQRFISAMRDHSIQCSKPIFKPIHRYLGLKGFPGTERFYKEAISIPCYPALSKKGIGYVKSSLVKVASSLFG